MIVQAHKNVLLTQTNIVNVIVADFPEPEARMRVSPKGERGLRGAASPKGWFLY